MPPGGLAGQLHQAAVQVFPPAPLPVPPGPDVPQPPPYAPGWLIRLWQVIFGILIGLFAGWLLFGD